MIALVTLSSLPNACALQTKASRLISVPRLDNLADAQRTGVVRIPGFLQPSEIDEISAAAARCAESAGEQDIHRRQGAPAGSWNTVFLNWRLHDELRHIHDRMFEAARAADAANWQRLDEQREDLAMRCVEYHSVTVGGGIPMEKHHDFGSLLTLDIVRERRDLEHAYARP